MYIAVRLIASVTLCIESIYTSIRTAKKQKTGRVSICIEAILFIWYATDFVFITHRILALVISILLLISIGFKVLEIYEQKHLKAQVEAELHRMEMIMKRLDGGGFIIFTRCGIDSSADKNQCIDVDCYEVEIDDEMND